MSTRKTDAIIKNLDSLIDVLTAYTDGGLSKKLKEIKVQLSEDLRDAENAEWEERMGDDL